MTTPGNAAADRLTAYHRAVCTRCRRPAARVVPAYWDPATRLCAACCIEVARIHDTTRWPSWPDPKESAA